MGNRAFTAATIGLGAVALLAGCGGGGEEFAEGDCISIQTNADGAAVRADDCSGNQALTVKQLATDGQRPDCGTVYDMEKQRMPVYVQDLTTDITYCGY
jgi:hypothetical protein